MREFAPEANPVMVGDRKHDIAAAHEHDIRAIGVLWGIGSEDELLTAGADALAHIPPNSRPSSPWTPPLAPRSVIARVSRRSRPHWCTVSLGAPQMSLGTRTRAGRCHLRSSGEIVRAMSAGAMWL